LLPGPGLFDGIGRRQPIDQFFTETLGEGAKDLLCIREEVIGRTGRDTDLVGDVPHRDRLEGVLTKKPQCRVNQPLTSRTSL
jgi:hypothetical protein